MRIPQTGLSKQEILSTLQAFKARDMDWKGGKVWCYVYDAGEDPSEVTKEAYASFLSENGLDPSVFPSILKLETDVARMVINLLRGDANAVGHLTSGGTESIMLAVKSARDKARVEKPQITHPEMIVPRNAHAAFHKAAHYLCVKPVVVDLDPKTLTVQASDMEGVISRWMASRPFRRICINTGMPPRVVRSSCTATGPSANTRSSRAPIRLDTR